MKLSTVTLSCFTAVCREKGFSPAVANLGKSQSWSIAVRVRWRKITSSQPTDRKRRMPKQNPTYAHKSFHCKVIQGRLFLMGLERI
jgi:hypothetical protein